MIDLEFILLFICIVCIDYLWLSTIKNKFIHMIEGIQKEKFRINLLYVFLAYLLMTFNMYYEHDENKAMWQGFYIYAIYHLTNLSTIQGWDVKIAITDIFWGMTLFYSVCKIRKSFS